MTSDNIAASAVSSTNSMLVSPHVEHNGWSPDLVSHPSNPDSVDGTYIFPINVPKAGTWTFHVFVDGMELQSSPISHVPFRPGPAASATTYAVGKGTHTTVIDSLASFTVHARDCHGNDQAIMGMKTYSRDSGWQRDDSNVGNFSFKANLVGPSAVRPKVTPIDDHSLLVEYCLRLSGIYSMTCLYNGLPIDGSEFMVTCLAHDTATVDADSRDILALSGISNSPWSPAQPWDDAWNLDRDRC